MKTQSKDGMIRWMAVGLMLAVVLLAGGCERQRVRSEAGLETAAAGPESLTTVEKTGMPAEGPLVVNTAADTPERAAIIRMEAAIEKRDWPTAYALYRQMERRYGSPEFITELGHKMPEWRHLVTENIDTLVADYTRRQMGLEQTLEDSLNQQHYFQGYFLLKRLEKAAAQAGFLETPEEMVEQWLGRFESAVEPNAIEYFDDYVLYTRPAESPSWRNVRARAQDVLNENSRNRETGIQLLRVFTESGSTDDPIYYHAENVNVYASAASSRSSDWFQSGDILIVQRDMNRTDTTGGVTFYSRGSMPVRFPIYGFEAGQIQTTGELCLLKSDQPKGRVQVSLDIEAGIDPENLEVSLRHNRVSELRFGMEYQPESGLTVSEPLWPGEYQVSVNSDKVATASNARSVQVSDARTRTVHIDVRKSRYVEIELYYRQAGTNDRWNREKIDLNTSSRMYPMHGQNPRQRFHFPFALGGLMEGELHLQSVTGGQSVSWLRIEPSGPVDEIEFPAKADMNQNAMTIPIREGEVYAILFMPPFYGEPEPVQYEVLLFVNTITTRSE